MTPLILTSRERDIGSFAVRRLLPHGLRRAVGPFVFFDHMGPAQFEPGQGMDVRPHPHIHLATVTYLFEGQIRHRDSLGYDQVIKPGDINWMTAGRGIVHSERTPPQVRKTGSRVSGLQVWVALPQAQEDVEPSFHHYPSNTLPEFEFNGIKGKVLVGEVFGHKSPVETLSPLFYVELTMEPGAQLELGMEDMERALYLIDGHIEMGDNKISPTSMAIDQSGRALSLKALDRSRLVLFGGDSLGERHIEWNFVSSSKDNIEKAKADWAQGPKPNDPRFPTIPGDDQEYIPFP